MNEYLSAVQSANPYAEAPNDWSKMLMSLADQNNSWSAEQAQKQMDFQERMSNTAHQREIADLKAAGLNPVLSAKLGGASTPSGASATADTSIVSSMVGLMNKMLDVQGTSASAAAAAAGAGNYGYGSESGNSYYNEESGLTDKGKNVIQTILDFIPGVSSSSAKTAATAIQDASKTGFGKWLVSGEISPGQKNTFQTPLKSKSPSNHSSSSHGSNGGR